MSFIYFGNDLSAKIVDRKTWKGNIEKIEICAETDIARIQIQSHIIEFAYIEALNFFEEMEHAVNRAKPFDKHT